MQDIEALGPSDSKQAISDAFFEIRPISLHFNSA
jgi:hypothetical protein